MKARSGQNTCSRCNGPVHGDHCVNPHCRIAELEDQVEALTAQLEEEEAEVRRLRGVILGAPKGRAFTSHYFVEDMGGVCQRVIIDVDDFFLDDALVALVKLSQDGAELADKKEADHA